MTRRLVIGNGFQCCTRTPFDFPLVCAVCECVLNGRQDFLCEMCREIRIQLSRAAKPPIGVVNPPVEFARR